MASRKLPFAISCLTLLTGCFFSPTKSLNAASQDLLNDNSNLFIDANHPAATLDLKPFVQMPGGFNDINSMTTRPGDTRMYVTTAEGTIFRVDDNGSGGHTATPWFDLASAMSAAGHNLWWDPNGANGGQTGLQSVAFHPGFNNPASPEYCKLYP